MRRLVVTVRGVRIKPVKRTSLMAEKEDGQTARRSIMGERGHGSPLRGAAGVASPTTATATARTPSRRNVMRRDATRATYRENALPKTDLSHLALESGL